MEIAIVLGVWLVTSLASACFCYTVAAAKGYDPSGWSAGGFFFGIFALIAIAGMPLNKDNVELAIRTQTKGSQLPQSTSIAPDTKSTSPDLRERNRDLAYLACYFVGILVLVLVLVGISLFF